MEQNIDEIIEKAESSNTLQIEDFEISDEHFERISKLTNLKYLYFHRIKNTNFPLSLSNLQFLEAFTATGEQITYIPSFLPNLPKLKYLNLGNTNIKDFSLLAKISNLNSLFLNNCKLNSIPKEILTLKLLKILSLNQNNISILPDDINQLKELKNIDISNNPLNSLQFGYLFTDEKRNFRYRFSELINNENKENDLFNFQDKNLSLTYSDNFIFFQNKENHGFIQIIEHVNEIELFRRKDAYSKYENSGGFIIYVFGNNEKQLETLILLRKHIEDWIKKNEIKYVSLISKRKEEMPHIANCMRFFYYRGNLLIKEIKGREFVIDFEKLLEI